MRHPLYFFSHRILFFACLLVWVLPSHGVNVIRQAKENLKKNQKLEQTIKDLLAEAKSPKQKQKGRIECYELAAECSKHINDLENVKLYLKQPYDTVKFFGSIRDIFRYVDMADSVSAQPNEKGVIARNNPQRYRDLLAPYRSNLLKGGMWYYRKGQLKMAYDYLHRYVQTAKSPVFMKDNLLTTDAELPTAAYLAVYCAQSEGLMDGVIEYAPLAKRAGQKPHLIQEFLARALEQKADTLHWVAALNEGLNDYPNHHYFFSHLVDYYTATDQLERGLTMCDQVLQQRDTVALYWYAKSLLLLRLHRDRDAIDACDRCIELQPNHANAYYNKGIASLNLAVIYAEQACTDVTDPRCKRDQEIIRSLYQLARQPMEKVRALLPNEPGRWAAPLYRIYLHLNMGREFDEMDRILNQATK